MTTYDKDLKAKQREVHYYQNCEKGDETQLKEKEKALMQKLSSVCL